MTDEERRKTLGRVVAHVIAVRGYSSPEQFEKAVQRRLPAGEKVGVGAKTIRRIIAAEDVDLDDDPKLIRLSRSMLGLPGNTLTAVYRGDVDALKAMTFLGDDEALGLREEIIALMTPPPSPRVQPRS